MLELADQPNASTEGRRENRVVVGVSMSLAGLQALRIAVAEARWRCAPLFAVRACAFRPPWTGPDVELVQLQLRQEARRYVCDAFNAAMGGVPHGHAHAAVSHYLRAAGRTTSLAERDYLTAKAVHLRERQP